MERRRLNWCVPHQCMHYESCMGGAKRHLLCIQDVPGVQLYTKVGTVQKGGQTLPVPMAPHRWSHSIVISVILYQVK